MIGEIVENVRAESRRAGISEEDRLKVILTAGEKLVAYYTQNDITLDDGNVLTIEEICIFPQFIKMDSIFYMLLTTKTI